MVIYIAGPYTGNVETNIQNAEQAAAKLSKLGWTPLTPHKNFAYMDKYKHLTYDRVMYMCKEMLYRCDAIFMLNRWEQSKGAIIECNAADLKGMKIYFEKDGYPECKNLS